VVRTVHILHVQNIYQQITARVCSFYISSYPYPRFLLCCFPLESSWNEHASKQNMHAGASSIIQLDYPIQFHVDEQCNGRIVLFGISLWVSDLLLNMSLIGYL
jgi:hypothetical protein